MVERIVVGLFHTNAYIFSAWKKECIVIDPGGDAEEFISHLTVKSLVPRGIICTHGHIDHISAAGLIQQHYLNKKDIHIPLAIHEEDSKYLGVNARSVHVENLACMGIPDSDMFSDIVKILPAPDVLLNDGDFPFESDLKVIHTPGHTPGSICLFSKDHNILFSGDTLFFEGIGRTDLPGGSMNEIISSIKEKIFTLPETMAVFPGHGPHTTLERELKHNPFINQDS